LPDGKRLLTCGGRVVRIWDIAGKKELRAIQGARAGLALSADGKRLIALRSEDGFAFKGEQPQGNGRVAVWNASGGQPIFAVKGHSAPVRTIAWAADGK